MFPAHPLTDSIRARNRAHTLRNAMKVEQYLTELEKVQGFAKSWDLRERLERGDITFDQLKSR